MFFIGVFIDVDWSVILSIDKITDQSTSINTPIKNITITGTDNSKQPIKNTVSTLPMGLTFD